MDLNYVLGLIITIGYGEYFIQTKLAFLTTYFLIEIQLYIEDV